MYLLRVPHVGVFPSLAVCILCPLHIPSAWLLHFPLTGHSPTQVMLIRYDCSPPGCLRQEEGDGLFPRACPALSTYLSGEYGSDGDHDRPKATQEYG
ncbi:hypothetical protein LZ30DRAFT_299944 [Colletotrichum cereale]|nr:hypothetical protein LZ30DRAFT_299944 [Colletotrichum cereale]